MKKLPPLHLLQALIVFAELKNQQSTAERLGLSQPAITKQFQQLEDYFDHPIFRTQGRRKLLTDYGQALAEEITIFFKSLGRNLEKVNFQFLQPRNIKLKIGGRKEFLDKYLTEIEFDGLLEIRHLSSTEIIEALKKNEIDIGVTHLNLNSADFVSKKLFTDRPSLIVPEKWMKKEGSFQSWVTTCHEYPVATYSEELLFLKEFIDYFNIKENLKLNYLVRDWTIVEKRVHAGFAWSIVPSLFTYPNRKYRILKGPDVKDHQYDFHIYYRKEFSSYQWFQTFLKDFRKGIIAT
jgi:DNA-binding transcriptional LysR family regulator